jgi:hypothetical protein
MDPVIFEENKPFVLEALCDGEVDYIEAASEVFEANFFRFNVAETQRIRCQWKRCYKMMMLLHTNRKRDFYVFVAVKVNLLRKFSL